MGSPSLRLTGAASLVLILLACGGDSTTGSGMDGGGRGDGAIDPMDSAIDAGRCGDGIVDLDAGEGCDDGNEIPADGCEPVTCAPTCGGAADCDDADPCNGTEICTVDHVCVAGTPLADGTDCTVSEIDGGRCRAGACAPFGCGDGFVEDDEECDDANMTDADGCEVDCSFSCDAETLCAGDMDACNGVEACDLSAHVCGAGAAPDCDDANPCTADSCDPATGCVHALVDGDGDGHAPSTLGACGDDCDDASTDVYAGAPEMCDMIDQDCDGDPLPAGTPVWFVDCDGDDHALAGSVSVRQCTEPAPDACGGGWTARAPAGAEADCDDSRDDVHPGATEIPGDGADADEDCDGMVACFVDADDDGARVTLSTASGDADCEDPAEARITDAIDCDDTRAEIHPGAAEQPGDVADADENCDGTVTCFVDADGDAYRTSMVVTSVDAACDGSGEARISTPPGDCNDAAPAIHPGAIERCDMARVDEDCDGMANPISACACSEGDSRMCPGVGWCATGTQTCRLDGTWGTCSRTPRPEVCDVVDDDCDGNVSEGPCSVANATSSCSVGACSVTDCNTGFCNGDGIAATGCELDLDTSPSCPGAATFLGSVSGDTGSANLTFTGNGQRYFRVRVNESDTGFCSEEDLCVQIELNPNGAAMDYDLYARCDGCATTATYSASSTAGTGAVDIVSLRWDEAVFAGCPTGSDSGRDVYVLVEMFSVDECNNYTLTVRGDVCGASNTCSAL